MVWRCGGEKATHKFGLDPWRGVRETWVYERTTDDRRLRHDSSSADKVKQLKMQNSNLVGTTDKKAQEKLNSELNEAWYFEIFAPIGSHLKETKKKN